MAIRIPIYTQQTATPQGGVQGGGLTSDVGRGIGGGLLDAAQAVGGFARERKAKMDEIETAEAVADAASAIAGFNRDLLRFQEEQKSVSGAGAKGYTDAVNAWATTRTDEILANAKNEKSRVYLTTQLTEARTRIDAASFGYEIEERQRNKVVTFESGIKSAADAAAMNPAQATLFAAQQRAAIMADPTLSEDVRAQLIGAVTAEVSFAAVLGDVEKNVYGAQQQLRRRLGFGTPEQGQAVNQGEVAGIMAEANRRAQAGEPDADIEAWMGDALAKAGVKVDTSRAGEDVTDEPSGDGRTWAYDSLTTQQVVSLLSRADAEIARRENEAKQAAESGKILLRQSIDDRMAAAAQGESVDIPDMATLVHVYGPEEGAIQAQKWAVTAGLAGDLQRQADQTNDQLAAVVLTTPVGAENRQFRDAAYKIRADNAQRELAMRKADPGGYVLQKNKTVAFAYDQYITALSAPQPDPAAIAVAQSRYLAQSTAAQTALGIVEPKLPTQFLSGIQQDMATAMQSNDVNAIEAATQRVSRAAGEVAAQFPEMAGQIAGLGDSAAFAVDGVPGTVIKRVADASAVKEAELKNALPSSVPWGQIESAVSDEFQPLLRTVTDGDIRDRYIRSAQRLVAEDIISGRETSVKAASRKAFNDLFGNDNVAMSTYRIPKAADPDRVVTGLADILREFPLDRVDAPVAEWMTDADIEAERRRNWRTTMAQARWVNNKVGDGVLLSVAGQNVLDVDGNPIEVKFKDAATYVPKAPANDAVQDQRRMR
jgi:hypothetical protein